MRWSVPAAVAVVSLLAAPACAQLTVAANREATASIAAMRARAPFSSRQRRLPTGLDTVLGRAWRGQFFSLSRRDGTIVLYTSRWRVRRTFALGASAEPEAMIVSGPCTAYVTRRNATHLMRLNLCTGATADVVDFSRFADADGVPDLGEMAIDRGRLFVQIRRYNMDSQDRQMLPAYIGVVDLATEQLIDVDPARAGVQAITLAGTAPKFAMQVVAATRKLFVCATGATFDAGGIEMIDLDALRSDGLVIREADGLTGADLGPIVMITPQEGYLVFTTDFTLSSHLHRFSLTGGVNPDPLIVSTDYAVPKLVHDAVTGYLFVPEGGSLTRGINVFAAATGQRLTEPSIATDGAPTDLLLLRPPNGP